MSLTASSLHSTAICPYCQSPFDTTEQIVKCSRCNTKHHADCWAANGGCAIHGCGSRTSTPVTMSAPISTTGAPWRQGASKTITIDIPPVQPIKTSRMHWLRTGLALAAILIVAFGVFMRYILWRNHATTPLPTTNADTQFLDIEKPKQQNQRPLIQQKKPSLVSRQPGGQLSPVVQRQPQLPPVVPRQPQNEVQLQLLEKGDTWTVKAPMPTARQDIAAAMVNGQIYVIGGGTSRSLDSLSFSTVEEYNPVTNKWRTMAKMPTARGGLAAAAVNGKIYAIGGYSGGWLSTVEEYNPITNSWRTVASMSTARNGLAAAVVNGRIYAIGGYDGNKHLKTVEEYNPITDTWRSVADMPTGRNVLATAVVNGKIYAIGGFDVSAQKCLNTVEEYNPDTSTWRSVASMPTARMSIAVAVVNGKIYVIGGEKGNRDLNIVEEYNPITDTWRTVAKMPTARNGLAAAVVNGKIYAIGGEGPKNTVEEYTPPTQKATLSEAKRIASSLHTIESETPPKIEDNIASMEGVWLFTHEDEEWITAKFEAKGNNIIGRILKFHGADWSKFEIERVEYNQDEITILCKYIDDSGRTKITLHYSYDSQHLEGTVFGHSYTRAVRVTAKQKKPSLVRQPGGRLPPEEGGQLDGFSTSPSPRSIADKADFSSFIGTWGEKWADVNNRNNITITQADGKPKVEESDGWHVWDEKFEDGVLTFRTRGGFSDWEFIYSVKRTPSGKMELTVHRLHDDKTFTGELYR